MGYVRLRKTLFGLDIAGFERQSRSDVDRMELRAALHRALDDALVPLNGHPADRDMLDRGDGVMMVFGSSLTPAVVVGIMLPRLAGWMAQFNELVGAEAGMQLRAVVHVGDVLRDDRGYIGSDLNLAFRLLDSPMLRNRLARGDSDIVVAVSEAARDELVASNLDSSGLAATDAEVVRVKETVALAWLLTPRARCGSVLGVADV